MAPTSAYQPSLLFLKVSTRPPMRPLASIMVTLSSWGHTIITIRSNHTDAVTTSLRVSSPCVRRPLKAWRRSVQRCPRRWWPRDGGPWWPGGLCPWCWKARCSRCLAGIHKEGLRKSHWQQTPQPRPEPEELRRGGKFTTRFLIFTADNHTVKLTTFKYVWFLAFCLYTPSQWMLNPTDKMWWRRRHSGYEDLAKHLQASGCHWLQGIFIQISEN